LFVLLSPSLSLSLIYTTTTTTTTGQRDISWEITDSNNDDIVSGGAPQEIAVCVLDGNYHVKMYDDFQDGWHDNSIVFSENGNVIKSCTITENDGADSTCDVEFGAVLTPTPTPTPTPAPTPTPTPTHTPTPTPTPSDSSSTSSSGGDDKGSNSTVIVVGVVFAVLGVLCVVCFLLKRKMKSRSDLPFVFMGRRGSSIAPSTGVSLSSLDGNADYDDQEKSPLERLETISFSGNDTSSSRGRMAKDWLKKTSSTRSTPPSIPYADDNDEDANIPVAHPVFGNSTMFDGDDDDDDGTVSTYSGKAAYI